jgi:hypothetical protein
LVIEEPGSWQVVGTIRDSRVLGYVKLRKIKTSCPWEFRGQEFLIRVRR